MKVLYSILIGYGCGNFMTAYILGKVFKNIDIRENGTKNVGASNAVVVMGWTYGAATWALDILKTTIAVLIVKNLYGDIDYAVYAGFAAILGHIYPVVLNFKGGKGASSIFGAMLAINFKVAIIMAITLTIITIVTDYIALGTIFMYVIVSVYFIWGHFNIVSIAISIISLILIIYKHKDNINRMLKGEEIGLRKASQINKERAN